MDALCEWIFVDNEDRDKFHGRTQRKGQCTRNLQNSSRRMSSTVLSISLERLNPHGTLRAHRFSPFENGKINTEKLRNLPRVMKLRFELR